jgi:hypothetical protein
MDNLQLTKQTLGWTQPKVPLGSLQLDIALILCHENARLISHVDAKHKKLYFHW